MHAFEVVVTADATNLKGNNRNRQIGAVGKQIILGEELVVGADAVALIKAMPLPE